jgi:RNA polymerase sigma-70 factor, ECF subfamily
MVPPCTDGPAIRFATAWRRDICNHRRGMDELEGFREGDPDAVRAVYRRHAGAVHTVARSIVGDPEVAADVVQQTFLKAWRSASSFDQTREVAPWLYAIARRTAIDVLRSERRPTTGGHAPEADVGVTPMTFERTWEILEVRQAVDALPDAEREVVRLTHLEGLTHAEAAEHLGVPIGTVKSRSGRAHQRLAVALGHIAPPANQIDDSGRRER